MPYVSKSQVRAFFAKERSGELPKGTARRWARHTEDIKSLPEKKGFVMTAIVQMARHAAEAPYVEKFAADAGMGADQVRHLASMVRMPAVEFCKQARHDPHAFNALVKFAMGVGMDMPQQPLTMPKPSDLHAKIGLGNPSAIPVSPPGGGGGSKLMELLAKLKGGGRLGKGLAGGAALAGAGGLAVGANRMLSGGGDMAPKPPAGEGGVPGAMGGPAEPGVPAPTPGGGAAAGGLSPTAKGLLAAGGVGLGAYGLSRVLGGKKKEKAAGDGTLVVRAMKRAALTKMAQLREKQARHQFTAYLDVLAGKIPTVEKRASVRTLQAEVSKGKPLSHAIKVAYPQLGGEQRGILASKLSHAAANHFKKANAGCGPMPTTGPMTQTGPAGNYGSMMGKMGV